jgi:hypothetical protein
VVLPPAVPPSPARSSVAEDPPHVTCFQVIRSWTSQTKDKVAQTADAKAQKNCPLTFLLQHFDVREPGEPRTRQSRVEVFPDMDPVPTPWQDVATWELLRYRLKTWGKREKSDNEGCLWLSEPSRAKNWLPLDDPKVPTLCCVEALNAAGWAAKELPAMHCLPMIERPFFDAREAIRMKSYFQCLLRAPAIFAFCPAWPSTAVVSFYRCLLAGICVTAGQSDAYYKHLLAGKNPNDFLAIEDRPVRVPPIGDARFGVASDDEEPKEKVKRKRATGVPRAKAPVRPIEGPVDPPPLVPPEPAPGTPPALVEPAPVAPPTPTGGAPPPSPVSPGSPPRVG